MGGWINECREGGWGRGEVGEERAARRGWVGEVRVKRGR